MSKTRRIILKIKELKLDDSTFISSCDNNEFNLISLDKKIKDQIIHNNGFLEISDYSPIINKPVSINTILKKYNSGIPGPQIPDFITCGEILNNTWSQIQSGDT